MDASKDILKVQWLARCVKVKRPSVALSPLIRSLARVGHSLLLYVVLFHLRMEQVVAGLVLSPWWSIKYKSWRYYKQEPLHSHITREIPRTAGEAKNGQEYNLKQPVMWNVQKIKLNAHLFAHIDTRLYGNTTPRWKPQALPPLRGINSLIEQKSN